MNADRTAATATTYSDLKLKLRKINWIEHALNTRKHGAYFFFPAQLLVYARAQSLQMSSTFLAFT